MNLRKKAYFVIPIENGLGKMFIPCSGEREKRGEKGFKLHELLHNHLLWTII